MNRRKLLGYFQLMVAGSLLPVGLSAFASNETKAITELKKSKADWEKLLPRDRYNVLFKEATEAPHSSPLYNEKRAGIFICAACYLPLFNSEYKYDSGTGWPSFFNALPNAIGKSRDFKLLYPRTEYHCARCGGHQGHIFDDGPKPTGLRYCNNGLALEFIPNDQQLPELRT